jgi:hypothetical protein
MQAVVKLACRGTKRKSHDQRILKPRFRYITNGAKGWQLIGTSKQMRAVHITGAMLWGESTVEDYRHDLVCLGCGNKLDRLGDNLVPRLDRARERGDKIVFLDELQ